MHYESKHVPLLRELAMSHFPLSHTRRYVHRTSSSSSSSSSSSEGASEEAGTSDPTERNATTPATVLIGTQADFDDDAIAELIFDNMAAFHTFYSVMQRPENAAKIAADEEHFLDRSRLLWPWLLAKRILPPRIERGKSSSPSRWIIQGRAILGTYGAGKISLGNLRHPSS
ncbi:EthD domain-containing protein [Xylariaceae sp. FL0016]|nr:EthD domain-containing protein [Xylariaceae sp. FL0016]